MLWNDRNCGEQRKCWVSEVLSGCVLLTWPKPLIHGKSEKPSPAVRFGRVAKAPSTLNVNVNRACRTCPIECAEHVHCSSLSPDIYSLETTPLQWVPLPRFAKPASLIHAKLPRCCGLSMREPRPPYLSFSTSVSLSILYLLEARSIPRLCKDLASKAGNLGSNALTWIHSDRFEAPNVLGSDS